MRIIEERQKALPLAKRVQNGKSEPLIELKSTERREFRIEVTPEDAQFFLDNMHAQQRVISWPSVDLFERLIRTGKFVQPSTPGIYVDQLGRVCNARHRLLSQVRCAATLTWDLVLGASVDEIRVLDQVRPRRIHQSYNMTGADGEKRMSCRHEAVIRQYIRLCQSKDGMLPHKYEKLSVEDVESVSDLYADDIAWATAAFFSKIAPASLVSAMAFARPVNKEAMMEFAEVYTGARQAKLNGDFSRHPAATLAGYMNTSRSQAGQNYTDAVIQKGLAAAFAHLNGRGLQRVAINSSSLAWFVKERDRKKLNLF